MSEKPISPPRQRMIEDMNLRNFGEKTRDDYIRHVKNFTAFLGGRLWALTDTPIGPFRTYTLRRRRPSS
jgi:hypothetical protein